MEVFREIETHFAKMESAQVEMTAAIGSLDAAQRQTTAAIAILGMKSAFIQEEMVSLRGAFAGIEAIFVAYAAQMADLRARMEVVEKRLPPAA